MPEPTLTPAELAGIEYAYRTHPITLRLAAALREAWRERDERQRFKDWVHHWLDGVGVPADPDPQGNASHGCRISGRMRWLLQTRFDAEAEVARLREENAKLQTQAEADGDACHDLRKWAESAEAEVARLREENATVRGENARLRRGDFTDEELQAQLDAVEPVPMSDEEIDELVERVVSSTGTSRYDVLEQAVESQRGQSKRLKEEVARLREENAKMQQEACWAAAVEMKKQRDELRIEVTWLRRELAEAKGAK